MIQFEQVTKQFTYHGKKNKVLDQLSLQIEANEIFGIVGESGSGKSTLLRMINTLVTPDSGKVTIAGIDWFQERELQQREQRKKIGMIFQQFNLLSNQTILQNVGLPLKLQKKFDKEKVFELLEFVNLTHKATSYPVQLSGGEKQRAGIARALITQPEILLCDEPTSALDGQNSDDVSELLKKINQTFGTTMVVVSHELELIKYLCNRAAIIENGRILDVLTITTKQQNHQFNSYYDRIKEHLQ